MKGIIKILACLTLLSAILLGGCVQEETGQQSSSTVPAGEQPVITVPATDEMNPNLVFSSFYKPEEVSFSPQVPAYQLPLSLDQIANPADLDRIKLNQAQQYILKKNGFVVIPSPFAPQITTYEMTYGLLNVSGYQIFITSDSILHIYHIIFDETLKRIEEDELIPRLIDMTYAMLQKSMEDYQRYTVPEVKEAARRNTAYFATALQLLQTPTTGYDPETQFQKEIERTIEMMESTSKRTLTDKDKAEIEQYLRFMQQPPSEEKEESKTLKVVEYSLPDYVKDDVEAEINNIETHAGFARSPIFHHEDDYSQYTVRGHYDRSDELRRYFKTMMFYGRMPFLLREGLVSEEDAKIATLQASLIAAELPVVKVNDKNAMEIWNRIYSVTSFFVGTAAQLTPGDYLEAEQKVIGTTIDISRLTDEDIMLELMAGLAKVDNPKVLGGTGGCTVSTPVTKEELYQCLDKDKGMRFMGQRFVPDYFIFQNLVTPAEGMNYTGSGEPFTMKQTPIGAQRCFPRALDVMAVLGSDRAHAILEEEGDTEYRDYEKHLADLVYQFSDLGPEMWSRNLYWSWLGALKPLLTDFGDGYPSFMQTEAWQDKELQTALASWTELKHDTILYAMQLTGGLGALPPEPVGYVEPVPEFYASMLALTKMTREGLAQFNVLPDTEKGRLDGFESIFNRLLNISVAELGNQELSDDDYDFIRHFGGELSHLLDGIDPEGKKTILIADIYTDITPPAQVLEEGIGWIDLMLVAYKVPEDRIILGVGPVFSYYEFKQPIGQRLTDESWRDTLTSDTTPNRPEWVNSFLAK
jgi:hypothetical protein